jgi:hypothetical protein
VLEVAVLGHRQRVVARGRSKLSVGPKHHQALLLPDVIDGCKHLLLERREMSNPRCSGCLRGAFHRRCSAGSVARADERDSDHQDAN